MVPERRKEPGGRGEAGRGPRAAAAAEGGEVRSAGAGDAACEAILTPRVIPAWRGQQDGWRGEGGLWALYSAGPRGPGYLARVGRGRPESPLPIPLGGARAPAATRARVQGLRSCWWPQPGDGGGFLQADSALSPQPESAVTPSAVPPPRAPPRPAAHPSALLPPPPPH